MKSVNHTQHVDYNVKPSEYNYLNSDQLKITSIFYTLQGEGPFGGYPSVFVRLSGCNIGSKKICDFCDTKFQFHLGKDRTFESILNEVKEKAQGKTNLIVITGGEPFLQKNVIKFVEYVNEQGWDTQFETNGLLYREIPKTYEKEVMETIDGDSTYPASTIVSKNTIVCSPKMAGETYGNLHPSVFDRADCLKFVVERNGKFNYIPDYALEFVKTGRPVYVSPINVYNRDVLDGEVPNFFNESLFNHKACQDNYKYAAELAMEKGLILNLQKHLFTAIE